MKNNNFVIKKNNDNKSMFDERERDRERTVIEETASVSFSDAIMHTVFH